MTCNPVISDFETRNSALLVVYPFQAALIIANPVTGVVPRGKVGPRPKALDLLKERILHRNLCTKLSKRRHATADQFGNGVSSVQLQSAFRCRLAMVQPS